MTFLTAEKICRKYDDQVILDRVSFSIVTQDRIGLVGKNGCGKTTLFDILARRSETDSGEVNRSRACLIDYMEQDISDYLDMSLFDYVASARDDLLQMHKEIAELEHHLARDPDDRNSLSRIGQLQNQFELEGGFSLENDIETILEGLGFEKDRHQELIKNFSGGEKNRAGLGKTLAGRGNLLLLDEPTNHLDIESTRWLEEFLQKTDKSYIVVSHDRAFLTATVNKIWELTAGKIEFYTGGLERYLTERADRRRLHAHRYRHQQEEIKRLEDFVRRHMAGQKTKQAQSKLKYLGRIKRLPPLRAEGQSARITLSSSGRSFAHVLSVRDVTLAYGSSVVAEKINFDFYRSDKVGLIGRNGSGKTTLLKSLVGELAPVEGEIRLGNNVDVAYFDQELSDLNVDETVLDSLWSVDPSAEIGKIRSFLARFGFTGEDSFKPIFSLSGGEKTKLALSRLLYHPANFIIFDEPTNNLDMGSRESLEEALINYDGSCLVVSHDRYFLDRVVSRIMHIKNKGLEIYEGNYSYFRKKTEIAPITVESRQPQSKDSYRAFKEQSRRRSRHQKKLTSTRRRIAEQETELKQLEKDISGNIPKSDWEKLMKAAARKKEVEEELLKLIALLEELEGMDID